jgi:prefoldin subunit 5
MTTEEIIAEVERIQKSIGTLQTEIDLLDHRQREIYRIVKK